MTSYKDDGIGLDGTETDFEDLLEQASSLSKEEAAFELLDCSRYGELDAVRAILDKHGSDMTGGSSANFVDSADTEESTALHKASGNGHAKVCRLLLARGASHNGNSSGNTPLHWAAANGHDKVVQLILEEPRLKGIIDVLKKNSSGRSSLTEGFSSSNTKVVGILLEHESAAEERLIGGVKKDEENADDNVIDEDGPVDKSDKIGSGACAVHEFNFRRIETGADNESKLPSTNGEAKTILVRELPIAHADDPFGSKAEEDTTGLGIWCASLVAARWMSSEEIASRFKGKTVMELGAGCGVPGLAVAYYSNASSILLTDLNPATVENMQYNIDLNKDRVEMHGFDNWCERVRADTINWIDRSTWPAEKLDVIICSDCIYQADIVPMLKGVVSGLLKPGGSFFYTCPESGRDGLPEFIQAMSEKGMELVKKSIACDLYRQNPLSSGDDEDCFLHFHELSSTIYELYEFRRCH